MKIILGTPRSGTTYVANWIANNNPDLIRMGPNTLGEYFHPDFFPKTYNIGDKFIPLKKHDANYVDEETKRRIKTLPKNCIFKIHPGPEMSRFIWEFIKDKPVILTERRDKLGQFISIGIGYYTNVWVDFNGNKKNGLQPGEKIEYKREWFDDLAERYFQLKDLKKELIIENTFFHDDLPLIENGKLPKKQSTGTTEEKLKTFTNKDDLLLWYNTFINELKYDN